MRGRGCPSLRCSTMMRGADLALLGWLADGCERYTPAVMLDLPQGVLLDITGCAHLFGSDGAAGEGFEIALAASWPHLPPGALGATPDSARAKAKYAKAAIGDLPVEALDASDKVHQALRRAGLKSIADLAKAARARHWPRVSANLSVAQTGAAAGGGRPAHHPAPKLANPPCRTEFCRTHLAHR